MFNLEQLHIIRDYEIEFLVSEFPKESRVLDIGGGTGYQAKYIASKGHEVDSIDIEASQYRTDQVFPVIDYDGKTIPFEDDTVDVIFSSNVLEHVLDVEDLLEEMKRVLKPGGVCIHAMPSTSWRFWTSCANYIEFVQRSWDPIKRGFPKSIYPRTELSRMRNFLFEMGNLRKQYGIPPLHGERGNTFTELWYFSIGWWCNLFQDCGFRVMVAEPIGLFYTGHMIFGNKWSVGLRKKLAPVLGSACAYYVIRVR